MTRNRYVVGGIGAAIVAMLAAGCGDGRLGKEFRDATASSFESGLTTIADGFINGVFTVYEPDTTSSSGQ